jgi:hypothetical protein
MDPCPRRDLDVEAEMHHVAVLHDVFLAFDAQLAHACSPPLAMKLLGFLRDSLREASRQKKAPLKDMKRAFRPSGTVRSNYSTRNVC